MKQIRTIFILIACTLPYLIYSMELTLFGIKPSNEVSNLNFGTIQGISNDLLYKIFSYCSPYTHCNMRLTNTSFNAFLSLSNMEKFLSYDLNVGEQKEMFKLCRQYIRNDEGVILQKLLDYSISKIRNNNSTSVNDSVFTGDCIIAFNNNVDEYSTNQQSIEFVKKLLDSAVQYDAVAAFNVLRQKYIEMMNNSQDISYYNILLHLAALHNSSKIAEVLILHGTTVNCFLYKSFTTPFERALLKENYAVMNVFMKYGEGVQEIETYKKKRCFKWAKWSLVPLLIITGLGMIVIEFSRMHYNSTKAEY